MNLPIAVWMSYTYFCEIPAAILEAGRIDGASVWQELWHLLRPMSLPGLSSTALILIIFAWNEAFWSINLTSANAAPLTAFIASYSSPEGLFLGEAIRRIAPCGGSDHGAWMAHPKTARPRIDFWRSEVAPSSPSCLRLRQTVRLTERRQRRQRRERFRAPPLWHIGNRVTDNRLLITVPTVPL